ncbi:hypothetical protein EBZ39_04125 [bacterium]|nr:hypothetical protein [bacterium]
MTMTQQTLQDNNNNIRNQTLWCATGEVCEIPRKAMSNNTLCVKFGNDDEPIMCIPTMMPAILPSLRSTISAYYATKAGGGVIEILPTDNPATRINKINIALPPSQGKSDLLGAIGLPALNGVGMIILPPTSGLAFAINVVKAGKYTFAFDVFGPAWNSDSFILDLTGPGQNIQQSEWLGAGDGPKIVEKVWRTLDLQQGFYKLTITGREPTGLVNVKIRPVTTTAPSPAPAPAPR